MKIFSIKNEKLEFFNRPIYCESEAEALSYIQNILMSDADRALSNLKDDLSLYYLGDIDFTSGCISPSCFETVEGKMCYDSICVCSLREIFDTIPEDKLKPSLTRDDITKCYDLYHNLSESIDNRIDAIYNILHHLDNSKKGGNVFCD